MYSDDWEPLYETDLLDFGVPAVPHNLDDIRAAFA